MPTLKTRHWLLKDAPIEEDQVPALQAVQTEEPSEAYVPALQIVH